MKKTSIPKTKQVGKWIVITPDKELKEFPGILSLRTDLKRLIAKERIKFLILNLKEWTYANGAATAIFMAMYAQMQGRFRICCALDPIRSMLDLLGFCEMAPNSVFDTEKEATSAPFPG